MYKMAPRKTAEQKKAVIKGRIAKKESQRDRILAALNKAINTYDNAEDRQEARKAKIKALGDKHDKIIDQIDALVKAHDALGGDTYHGKKKASGGRKKKTAVAVPMAMPVVEQPMVVVKAEKKKRNMSPEARQRARERMIAMNARKRGEA